jgi:hypothetical protein
VEREHVRRRQSHEDLNNGTVQARLHAGVGGKYLWVTNPSRAEAKVTVSVSGQEFTSGVDLWAAKAVAVDGRQITVSISGRDAAVIALR